MGFFGRVESKASVVLALDTGMLAVLAANVPSPKYFEWKMIFAIVPVILIGVSYWFLFRISFPDLKGGTSSLIYFREIAKRTEHKFIEEFKALDESAYINDLLGQVWRNSEILSKKFDLLRAAFVLMLWAVIPWLVSVALFALKNNEPSHLLTR